MNKKILFAAVGAALAVAPMISAQADVKVGGRAHVSLDSLDQGAAADIGSLFLSSNSSNIYVSAKEDVGGGLQAVAHWETTVTLDKTGAPAGDRNLYVGLKGGFGRVILGQHDDPVKETGRSVDLFHNEQLGESRAITRQTASTNRWDERIANSIRYDSNDMGGFTFAVQYGVEDVFANDYKTTSIGATYKAGPLMVGGSYKTIGAATDLTGMRLAASYDMGAIKLVGFYQTADVSATVDQSVLGLGAAFKAGNNTFKAQWYQADETASGANNGGTQTSFGIDHALSKSTIIYATYAKTSNDSAAAYGVGNGGGHGQTTAPGLGVDTSGVSFGIRMNF